jgi:hypothetical protein
MGDAAEVPPRCNEINRATLAALNVRRANSFSDSMYRIVGFRPTRADLPKSVGPPTIFAVRDEKLAIKSASPAKLGGKPCACKNSH